jgi:hypothetical protein
MNHFDLCTDNASTFPDIAALFDPELQPQFSSMRPFPSEQQHPSGDRPLQVGTEIDGLDECVFCSFAASEVREPSEGRIRSLSMNGEDSQLIKVKETENFNHSARKGHMD